MSILSERLSAVRKERKYTQARVTELLNNKISIAQLSNYETGKREPDFVTFCLLANCYHVSSDYLLGLSDEEVPQTRDVMEATGLSNYAISMFYNVEELSKFVNEIFDREEVGKICLELFLIQNMINRINNEKKSPPKIEELYLPDNTESVRISSEDFFELHAYKMSVFISEAIKKWAISEYGGCTEDWQEIDKYFPNSEKDT